MPSNNRVKLFPDMAIWRKYIQERGFHFSFGSRIHGNIMSILAGIPAVVYACDSRTRDMAEFFDIPMLMPTLSNEKIDLFQLYQNVDYSRFNCNIGPRYDEFEEFLQKYGIVKRLNVTNVFFESDDNLVTKSDGGDSSDMFEILRQHRLLFSLYDVLIQKSREIRGLS